MVSDKREINLNKLRIKMLRDNSAKKRKQDGLHEEK